MIVIHTVICIYQISAIKIDYLDQKTLHQVF